MTRYEVKPSNKFKKDMKRIQKRGYNFQLMTEVLSLLADGKPLPERYKDHALSGNFVGCRECHITPDWLLIYRVHEEKLLLLLTRTGSHSDARERLLGLKQSALPGSSWRGAFCMLAIIHYDERWQKLLAFAERWLILANVCCGNF